MVSLEGLIKFCELKGFLRRDFEEKEDDGSVIRTSPRFFIEPEEEDHLIVLQMDEKFSRSGKQKTRFFASWDTGTSVRCTFDHLRFTEKGLEYWLKVEDVGLTDSNILIVKR